MTLTLVSGMPNPEGGSVAAATSAQNSDAVELGSSVEPADRDRVLPHGWRSSNDLAWTTAGDSTGFHLLVAEARSGYAWRTVASLWEPGFDTDRWIGNVCLTGSGKRAVVAYAPRQFTNRPELFTHGAFAAVVDIASGKVRKLGLGVSLAYFNPGCGTGEEAVLTQNGDDRVGRTRLHWLDTATGRIGWKAELRGDATSAVPVGERIVTVTEDGLVAVHPSGKRETLVKGAAFRMHPDARGGLVFMRQDGDDAVVYGHHGGRTVEFARGPITNVNVTPGTHGRVFITGDARKSRALPARVTQIPANADAEVSTHGALVFDHVVPAPGDRAQPGVVAARPDAAMPVRLRATATETDRSVGFMVFPGERPARYLAQGAAPSPALPSGGGQESTESASATNPVDEDRTCAVPRNDARTQVYQPHWKQVEWAANLAVQDALYITRPDNWKKSGVAGPWQPQAMFKAPPLRGGGRVPAQVMLGILAQESNLWQATGRALPGVTGNPLVGNFYGLTYSNPGVDYFKIDWSRSDCGYGVAQVTDGMRRDAAKPTANEKRAIAMDYATNIAAGLQILHKKWNQLYDAGIVIDDGDPQYIENWFAAVWAYNSGVNPQANTGNTSGCTPGPNCTDGEGNWGLGWTNNPARELYPRNRTGFLDDGTGKPHYDDARHPQHWPYPEKVMGWAAHPIIKYELDGSYSGGYKWATWSTDGHRASVKPPPDRFCQYGGMTDNHCNAVYSQPCLHPDFHCWWHWSNFWKLCSYGGCGTERLAYKPGDPEPPGVENYAPACSTYGLPANALVIDDVPDSVPIVRPGCSRATSNAGTFGLRFSADAEGYYRSKVDFHQIGGGYHGHFWFAHNRVHEEDRARVMQVEGTWTLNQQVNGWMRVLVHMPDHGARTQQAPYTVHLGDGITKTRAVPQKTKAHTWVPLGAFKFAGTPKVSLTNVDQIGGARENVAFDAVAFQPLPGKPRHQIVAMGDSFSAGEGAAQHPHLDYYRETNDNGDGNPDYRNGCHRSLHSWSRQAKLSDSARSIGYRADDWDASMDFHFIACSGAETENMLPPGVANEFGEYGQGQHRELSQFDKGFLDENTTLVTFSIGGNDARFVDVLIHCITHAKCHATTYQDDGEPLDAATRKRISGDVKESVRKVVRNIHEAAPKAKIVLMGYPRLFDGISPTAYCLNTLEPEEIAWIHDMVALMNDELLDIARSLRTLEGIPAEMADPRIAFLNRGACTAAGESAEAIHRIILEKTEGEKPGPRPSQQSIHPNIAGAGLYARAFEATLLSMGL
ncbi:golvesin C-terminal-like domain-containing protein [Micromonospora deserti]|uniref:golvesin C-terminal-like domain-containing protein n=1 Tax=Micromonospora deserti TaxID=2070366 RepID=UPI001314EC3D|nr:GDSL-type esterase/lipase family protein [Micromonospora deserti]